MTKAWRFWIGLFSMGVMVGTQAHAASAEGRAPVTLSVALRAEFTDNRDATETAKESNTDYYISPRIDAYMQGDRTQFDFFYAPSLRYRSDPSPVQDDSEVLHDVGLNVDHRASDQTALRLREKFSYRDDPAIEDLGASVRDDRTYSLNQAEVGLRQSLNRETFVDIAARHMMKAYEDSAVAKESDEDRVDGDVTFWRSISPTLGVRAVGGYSSYGFESKVQGIERDFDMLLGSLGIEKVFGPELRVGIDGGVQSADYADPGLDTETFPYAKLDATLSPTEELRAHAIVSVGARDSDVYPFASQEYTEFKGAVDFDPPTPVSIGASVTYRQSTYNPSSRPETAPLTAFRKDTQGNEDTLVISGHASWTLNDRTSLTLRQRYEDVDSEVEETYKRNTSSVELRIEI
jgi:hypothetical protein